MVTCHTIFPFYLMTGWLARLFSCLVVCSVLCCAVLFFNSKYFCFHYNVFLFAAIFAFQLFAVKLSRILQLLRAMTCWPCNRRTNESTNQPVSHIDRLPMSPSVSATVRQTIEKTNNCCLIGFSRLSFRFQQSWVLLSVCLHY